MDAGLWREMMVYLREKHASLTRQWFEDLEPMSLDSGLLQVYAGTAVQQNYLQRRCREQFTEAAQAVTGKLVVVSFVLRDSEAAAAQEAPRRSAGSNGSNGAHGAQAAHGGQGAGHGVEAPRAFEETIISPDYSFENFVTGPENRLAHAAAVAVATQPGVAYNPLFIHGGVGLGKTHLLQATCQRVLRDNPKARICYLSCDAFISDYVDCVQRQAMADFRQRYRQLDVLVIDDVHFLAERERTQEEFFHTFNELHQSKRQLVLSSDSPPEEIKGIEERLSSRFRWGLVASVSRPSYETRLAIVNAKAQLRGIAMTEEVKRYIAHAIDSNARELEGAITTLQGHAQLQGRAIDLALAHEALAKSSFDSRTAQAALQSIITVVIEHYGVRLSDLQSKRRHRSITLPRQVCMFLARRRTNLSLQEIGGHFGGRDHTTVMHSIQTVQDRIEQDAQFAEIVTRLDTRSHGLPASGLV
jgi:chromosomal replication initiator protein